MQTKIVSKQSIFYQSLFAAAIIIFLLWLGRNVAEQLAARGIVSGFDFLQKQAGFAIGFHIIPYSETSSLGRAFLVGLTNTLMVSLVSVGFASVLGLGVALMRLSKQSIVRLIGDFYVETLRNVPLLLQLFFWYFAVLRQLPLPKESWQMGSSIFFNIRGLYFPIPDSGGPQLILALLVGLVTGHFMRRSALTYRLNKGRYPVWQYVPFLLPLLCPLLVLLVTGSHYQWDKPFLEGLNFSGGLHLPPELLALIFSLSLYTAAFIGEIIRGALLAVASGQTEAAYALGLNKIQIFRLVIFPQALRMIIPPLISQYLNLIKNSSLAAAIAFPDLVLVFAGTTLNLTGQAVEIMVMTMGVYLIISLLVSTAMNLYQQRTLRYER